MTDNRNKELTKNVSCCREPPCMVQPRSCGSTVKFKPNAVPGGPRTGPQRPSHVQCVLQRLIAVQARQSGGSRVGHSCCRQPGMLLIDVCGKGHQFKIKIIVSSMRRGGTAASHASAATGTSGASCQTPAAPVLLDQHSWPAASHLPATRRSFTMQQHLEEHAVCVLHGAILPREGLKALELVLAEAGPDHLRSNRETAAGAADSNSSARVGGQAEQQLRRGTATRDATT
jgi:hypothetical protein